MGKPLTNPAGVPLSASLSSIGVLPPGASLPDQIQRAQELADRGQPSKAAGLLLQILQADPACMPAALLLGQTLIGPLGQIERGLSYFDVAIRVCPDDDAAVRAKARALRELGRIDEARQCLLSFAQLPGGSARGWLLRGILLQELGRIDTAVACLRTCIDCVRDEPASQQSAVQAMLSLGTLLTWNDRVEEAIGWLGSYLRLRPKDAAGLQAFAAAANWLGEHDQAVEALERLRLVQPTALWVLLALGRVVGLELHNPDPGLAYLSAFDRLESKPKLLALSQQIRGEIEDRRGQLDAALAALNKAVRLDPNDAQSHYLLAKVHSAKGEERRARKFAQQASDLNSASFFSLAVERVSNRQGLVGREAPSVPLLLDKLGLV